MYLISPDFMIAESRFNTSIGGYILEGKCTLAVANLLDQPYEMYDPPSINEEVIQWRPQIPPTITAGVIGGH
jgi:hypothetical protein